MCLLQMDWTAFLFSQVSHRMLTLKVASLHVRQQRLLLHSWHRIWRDLEKHILSSDGITRPHLTPPCTIKVQAHANAWVSQNEFEGFLWRMQGKSPAQCTQGVRMRIRLHHVPRHVIADGSLQTKAGSCDAFRQRCRVYFIFFQTLGPWVKLSLSLNI